MSDESKAAAWTRAAELLSADLSMNPDLDVEGERVRTVVIPHLRAMAERILERQRKAGRRLGMTVLSVPAAEPPTYGELLRQHRHARGYSLPYVADIIGVPCGELSEVEHALRAPFDVSTTLRFCDVLFGDAVAKALLVAREREGWP